MNDDRTNDTSGFSKLTKGQLQHTDLFGRTALHLAVAANSPGAVRLLLKLSDGKRLLLATDHENGWNPCHYAVFLHRPACLGLLQAHRGYDEAMRTKDRCGFTPAQLVHNDPQDFVWVPRHITRTNRVHLAPRFGAADGKRRAYDVPWHPARGGSVQWQTPALVVEPVEGLDDAVRADALSTHASSSSHASSFSAASSHSSSPLLPPRYALFLTSKRFALALTADHRLFDTLARHGGARPWHRRLAPEQVVDAAISNNHAIARTADDLVFGWGLNSYNQLGFTTAASDEPANFRDIFERHPRGVPLRGRTEPLAGVACLKTHLVVWLALTLWLFGLNAGQMGVAAPDAAILVRVGDRTYLAEVQPHPVPVLVRDGVKCVATCETVTVVVTAKNEVWAWHNHQRTRLPKIATAALSFDLFKPGRLTQPVDIVKAVVRREDWAAVLSAGGDVYTFDPRDPRAEYTAAWRAHHCLMRATDVDVSEDRAVVVCTRAGQVLVRPRGARQWGVRPGAHQVQRVCCDGRFERFAFVCREADPLPVELAANGYARDVAMLLPLVATDPMRKQWQLLEGEGEEEVGGANGGYDGDDLNGVGGVDGVNGGNGGSGVGGNGGNATTGVHSNTGATGNNTSTTGTGTPSNTINATNNTTTNNTTTTTTTSPTPTPSPFHYVSHHTPGTHPDLLRADHLLRRPLRQPRAPVPDPGWDLPTADIAPVQAMLTRHQAPKGCDHTLQVGPLAIPLHRRIASANCRKLAAMLALGPDEVFTAGAWRAVTAGAVTTVQLPHHPVAVAVWVHYVYTQHMVGVDDDPQVRQQAELLVRQFPVTATAPMSRDGTGDVEIVLDGPSLWADSTVLRARLAYFETRFLHRWGGDATVDWRGFSPWAARQVVAHLYGVPHHELLRWEHGGGEEEEGGESLGRGVGGEGGGPGRGVGGEKGGARGEDPPPHIPSPYDYINDVLDVVELADELLLDGLKLAAEAALAPFIAHDTVVALLEYADAGNAPKLFVNCAWHVFVHMERVLFDGLLRGVPEATLLRLEPLLRWFAGCADPLFAGTVPSSPLERRPELLRLWADHPAEFNEVYISDAKGCCAFEPVVDGRRRRSSRGSRVSRAEVDKFRALVRERRDARVERGEGRAEGRAEVRLELVVRTDSENTSAASSPPPELRRDPGRKSVSPQPRNGSGGASGGASGVGLGLGASVGMGTSASVGAGAIGGAMGSSAMGASASHGSSMGTSASFGSSMGTSASIGYSMGTSALGASAMGTSTSTGPNTGPTTTPRYTWAQNPKPVLPTTPSMPTLTVEKKPRAKIGPIGKLSQKQRKKLNETAATAPAASGSVPADKPLNPWGASTPPGSQRKGLGSQRKLLADYTQALPVLGSDRRPSAEAPKLLTAVMLEQTLANEAKLAKPTKTLAEIQQEEEFARWWEQELKRVQKEMAPKRAGAKKRGPKRRNGSNPGQVLHQQPLPS